MVLQERELATDHIIMMVSDNLLEQQVLQELVELPVLELPVEKDLSKLMMGMVISLSIPWMGEEQVEMQML